jgi:hypothetical protein
MVTLHTQNVHVLEMPVPRNYFIQANTIPVQYQKGTFHLDPPQALDDGDFIITMMQKGNFLSPPFIFQTNDDDKRIRSFLLVVWCNP